MCNVLRLSLGFFVLTLADWCAARVAGLRACGQRWMES